MDIPSVAVHWISVLERHGAREAHRAYWFEAGTFDGLFTTSGQPTASYWAYRGVGGAWKVRLGVVAGRSGLPRCRGSTNHARRTMLDEPCSTNHAQRTT